MVYFVENQCLIIVCCVIPYYVKHWKVPNQEEQEKSLFTTLAISPKNILQQYITLKVQMKPRPARTQDLKQAVYDCM